MELVNNFRVRVLIQIIKVKMLGGFKGKNGEIP